MYKAARTLGSIALLSLLFAVSSTLFAESRLIFPRLSFDPGELTGIAIVNAGSDEAILTLSAYGPEGQLLSAEDVDNPRILSLAAGQQTAFLASQFFPYDQASSAAGWLEVSSPQNDLTGFFLIFDNPTTLLDGADLPQPFEQLIFNSVSVGSETDTEINIVNPGESEAQVTLRLTASAQLIEKSLLLLPRGVTRLDAADFFQTGSDNLTGFITLESTAPVAGFQVVRGLSGDLIGLNAQQYADPASLLYFPQMAVGGPWRTDLSLSNPSSAAVIVTLTAYKADGSLYDAADLQTNPVTRSLPAGSSLDEDIASLFGFDTETVRDGWIHVQSSAPALAGSIRYGVPAVKSMAAVTPQKGAQKQALFAHLATSLGYFTGLALLNPGSLISNVEITALDPAGQVLGSYSTVLQPRQRISRLITEMIPEAAGRAGGLISVRSQLPLYQTSLFGTSDVLANVPAQPAPAAYVPDTGQESLRISPPLAVVQPGGTQQFRADGSTQTVLWKVNGVEGGDTQLGSIDSSGTYRAPNTLPASLPVAVTAEVQGRTAGASVDVLQRNVLVSGLGIIQSVAYLGSLQRLYTAELAASGAAAVAPGRMAAATATLSQIREVAPQGGSRLVAELAGDEVPKMIPFRSSGGQEFLLLAARNSGRIVRLDTVSDRTVDVATGLTEPAALVIDPTTGDLLVAEKTGVSIVPRAQLEFGQAAFASVDSGQRRLTTLIEAQNLSGIAVDTCTGSVYLADHSAGAILILDRQSGTLETLVTGLDEPGQLLGIQRSGVDCPDSFHLLVVENGSQQVSLVVPSEPMATLWLNAPGVRDLALLPPGNPYNQTEGVVVGELPAGQGQLSIVETPALYEVETVEPDPEPDPGDCPEFPGFEDPRLEAAVRSELKLGSSEPISCEVAGQLFALDVFDAGIESLGGIEFFTNLRLLRLMRNRISDLAPIGTLTELEVLEVSDNLITDLGPVSSLDKLDFLGADGNLISDLTPVAEHPTLRTLTVHRNSVSSLVPLSRVTRLETLIVGRNQVTDLAPISALGNLRHLDAPDNKIQDIFAIASLSKLQVVRLTGNRISDVSSLAELPDLQMIDLGANLLSSVKPLIDNPGIGQNDDLDVRGNPLGSSTCSDLKILKDRGVRLLSDVNCTQ